MPRFFFHIHDGKNLPDEEGTELPDWEMARTEAVALAGRLIADDAKRIPLGEDWCMEVTDAHGLLLFKLDFHVTASPAVRNDRLRKERPS